MNESAMKTILFTGAALPEEHRKKLTERGYTVKIEHSNLSESELITALKGVSAYILGGVEKATKTVLEASPDLKVVAFFGVGYENYIDAKAATELGIAVTNTPGANARSVAEFTIALMLDAIKRVTFLIDATMKGDWKEIQSRNLEGRTLGIVGMGTIGQHVAKIAQTGFGMNIVYTGRTRKHEVESALGAKFTTLTELLKASDVLSLHAAINNETEGMIGEKELAIMKTDAVLINCSRAELVNPAALKYALENKKLGCAAFDGYYVEPVPPPENDPHGLIGLSRQQFLVSPHTAYFTEDATRAMADMAIKSVTEILENRQSSNVINPEYKVQKS